MAQSMILFFVRCLSVTGSGLLIIVGAMMSFSSCAQELKDPTRPPIQLQELGSGEMQTTGPVLQSVLISPARKLAMIDGVAVRLNGKFGTQTLVKITETEVVLRQGRIYQTLKLHPDFEKKPKLVIREKHASATRP